MIKYVIDSCALINIAKNYNMEKTIFKKIWNTLDDMIEQGQLITSSEVKDELKDDDLIKWTREKSKVFIGLSKDIQEQTIQVLGLFPNLIQMKSSGNSNADPFLIALAILEKATLVTDEHMGGEENPKIPNVCKYYNLDYMSSHDFINSFID